MTKKQTTILSIFLFLLSLGFSSWSCTRSPEQRQGSQKRLHGRKEDRPAVPSGRQGLAGRHGGGDSVLRAEIQLTEEEASAFEIQTVKAVRRTLGNYLPAVGKVYAPQTKKAIVSYAFPARIAEVHVRIGDWVRKGQRLVTLQSEEVGVAKSDFYKARADYELARSNFEREKHLFEGGVGAQKNFQATEAELKVAEASLNAAEKKLHVLGFTEDQVRSINETHQINPIIDLYAPLAGKVIENNAVLGAMVDESTEILIIIDPTVLWIDAEVFERDLAKIRPGQCVEVKVPAYPGQIFEGRVSYIGDVLKEDTRTITVRSEVPNKGGLLKPGMFADIRVCLEQRSDSLVLPNEALLEDGKETVVFVRRNGQFIRRPVKKGISDDGYVEILEGVKEGEEVVTRGNYQIKSKYYRETLKKAGVH